MLLLTSWGSWKAELEGLHGKASNTFTCSAFEFKEP